MTKHDQPSARFDERGSAVVVEQITIRHTDVVREAQRWTTGERSSVVDDIEVLANADLTNFVTEAVRIGAHALSVTGQAQEVQVLERMLQEAGDKTADSASKAAELTGRAVKEASDAVANAASEAKRAIAEAGSRSRKEFTSAVTEAKRDLNNEVRGLFGGESPELLDRLLPLLDRFGADLDKKVSTGTSELLAKAAKQFDPTDPTSPMARHAAQLNARQKELTEQLNNNHAELARKVDELTTAIKVQEAKTTLANVTPIKGDSYAGRIHTLLVGIAAGLGDEYDDTSARIGHLPRCKKGDGLLTVNGGSARVLVEMTDSARGGWTDYLDEAERNRDAIASLGLVRTAAQNAGHVIRVIGAHRVVMAFDPDTDDPDVLRTVVLLLRTVAITASARKGAHEIATAEEKINEALAHLAKINSVKKLSASIQKSATKIDDECNGLHSGIRRLLDDALVALAGTQGTKNMDAVGDGVENGAA